MHLPFDHDQFLDLFGAYNRALWPLVLVLWLGTAMAVFRLYQGKFGAGRVLGALLALHWAWAGAVYHLVYFRRINPPALAFGIVFLVEAVLLAWRGVIRGRLTGSATGTLWSGLGLGLITYAMLYPALGQLLGLRYPRLPTFGVPCPTTILTVGVLLLVPRREARLLGVIPVLWAAIGGSAVFALGIRADVVLLVSALALVGYVLSPASPSRRETGAPQPAAPPVARSV